MFRSSLSNLIDKATNNLQMEPDWQSILQICDKIRQKDEQPKNVISLLRKKLFSTNQYTALYALSLLESLMKNCGTTFHEEMTQLANCQMLRELAKTTTHDSVRQKLLELMQAWSVVFRDNPKYQNLKDAITALKIEGFKFPTVERESEVMFTADTAPQWVDGDVCHRCRTAFSMINRKHHCRSCGQVFCGQCSEKTTTLPKLGIEKEVRVCDACYDQALKPSTATSKASNESDLPPEYLNSSLAKQSQAPPPRKNEDELREEEELQLALALSQSEAEAKEKEKYRGVRHEPKRSTPSPVEEDAGLAANAANPELARYLNRSYWESLNHNQGNEQAENSPSAPAPVVVASNGVKSKSEVEDEDLESFIKTLKSQIEIFINRMKSNSSRGRSIANDTSVQSLFMNITAMHSRLLRYIQLHDDRRLYFERLQDKLTQVKDARAALDALRDEHREKLRREAEEAERQRQLQMAHKLEIMRKKKQEYLLYQRQLALQRIQEQEREMQIRQEQQKQQYLMGPQYGGPYIGSPVHGQYGMPSVSAAAPPPQQQPQPTFYHPQYAQPMMGMPQSAPPPPHELPTGAATYQPMMPPQFPQQSQAAYVPQPMVGVPMVGVASPNNPTNQTEVKPKIEEKAPTAELISFD